MSVIETAPGNLLVEADQIDAVGQLHILEAMHRRILMIGNERAEATPLIEGAPEPGPLGGQYAKVRRTLVWKTLFYVTHSDGAPMEGVCSVPLLPIDEYHLMNRINELGTDILNTMSTEDRRRVSRERTLR